MDRSYNLTLVNGTLESKTFENSQTSALDVETYRYIQYVAYRIVMPGVLGLGIVGNILNIFILCKQRLQRSMDKMERCATMGFIFLAISDLAFCAFGFPSVFLGNRHFANLDNRFEILELLYMLYRPGILNTFLFSSTWCVVLIAIERYIVVIHPMKAQSSIRLRRTIILQVIIPVTAVIINIPDFLKYKFTTLSYANNQTFIMPAITQFAHIMEYRNVYFVIWNIIGTIIPVILLTFCNVQLIRAVFRTRVLGPVRRDKHSTSRITVILISIIALYILLVCPSTILHFIQEIFISQKQKKKSYNIPVAVVIINVLQTVNFAINFVLYFGMHPKFRANTRLQCQSCNTDKHLKKRLTQYELIHINDKGPHNSTNI